jgi:hypothetical protein
MINGNVVNQRMALYLTGRLFEMYQGWLYNYFIFIFDDASLTYSYAKSYERFLHIWQPAISFPGINTSEESIVTTVNNFNFDMIGYHREVLDVLFPFEMDFGEDVDLNAHILHALEASLLYRNHILTFNILQNQSTIHRKLSSFWQNVKELVEESSLHTKLSNILKVHLNRLPKHLIHCTVLTVDELLKQFSDDVKVGAPRPKSSSYHLLDHNHHHGNYGFTRQKFCVNRYEWDPTLKECCTIDNWNEELDFHDNVMYLALRNRVVTANKKKFYYISLNKKILVTKEMLSSMGISEDDIQLVRIQTLGRYPWFQHFKMQYCDNDDVNI